MGPKGAFDWWHVMLVEAIYTNVVCFVYLNTVVCVRNNPKNDGNQYFAIAIGFVLIGGGYAATRVSGASFNPALALAVGVTAKATDRFWLLPYMLFQFGGAIMAVITFAVVRPEEFLDMIGDQEQSDGWSAIVVRRLSACSRSLYDLCAMIGKSPHSESRGWGAAGPHAPQLAGSGVGIAGSGIGLGVNTSNTPRTPRADVASVEDGTTSLDEPVVLGEGSSPMPARLMSEFIGTFMMVLTFGLNTVSLDIQHGLSRASAGWGAGAIMCGLAYALAGVSGAHFGPATTLAVWLTGRGKFTWVEATNYATTQILAGVLAGIIYAVVQASGPNKDVHFKLEPKAGFSWWSVVIAETLFTSMIILTMLAVTHLRIPGPPTHKNFQYGLAKGLSFSAAGFALSGITGGQLNPALSVGIFVADGVAGHGFDPFGCVAFCACQLAGGLCAAGLFVATRPSEFKEDPLVSYGK
eukprot:gnl/TRDRNA2_/TRDRNA2_161751_c1_seq1.p1 gnl/TRDRNA2_/TRDRNA2_161751_c1~~gnl/TRDRNA2_/TRDRNA2_161751_c1_seq1.p1  ORF type:complete len:518 (-),score=79.32 gnl/TRDRNA2_/TRDRNA2_161751_c1_seq1:53-1450(-)